MSALQTMLDAGLTLHAAGDRLIVHPASLLDDALRDLIRSHKSELLRAARDADATSASLIESIRDCCALRGDSDANVAALLAEVPDFTIDHQRDLIEHFANEAAIWRAATGAAP